MFFYWQEVLAVIEMLLVGHFSSKQGFCPSEFPVLENLRRVILEPRSRSRLSSGPFISICYNPTKQKFQYFSPGTGCLFVPVILYQTQLLPPAVEPRPLRPCFEEIVQFHPRFDPLSKVYDVCISGHAMHQAVSRGRKQYLSGCSERVRYRDAIKFQ